MIFYFLEEYRMNKKCPKCGGAFLETAMYCPKDGVFLETENPNSPQSLIGKVLDSKYQIQQLIGEGGMGNVYEAKHLHIGLPVAIKILHQKLTKDSTAVERFRREARSARTIDHPNAVRVLDFGITLDNILYLVMELIDGISLQKILEKETTLSASRAINLMKQVCLAVDAAHKKSIIHRDLKPDNILIINAGTDLESVKVIDFSIAKITQSTVDPNITVDGLAVGTPQYISPEQAQGDKDLNHRADIYSLGCILYQMLTGKVPFQGKTTAMTLMQHIQMPPKPLREINPEIPVALEQVVLKALAKNPSARHQSAALLANDLQLSLSSPQLFVTNITIPVANNNLQENKPRVNEQDIIAKMAIPAVETNKLSSKEGKGNNSKDIFERSGKLLTKDKDDILPTLQPEKNGAKKTFWQWLFSWFSVLLSH